MSLYALMLQFCRLIVSTEEISTNSGPWITNICPKKFDSKHYSFCMYDNEQTGVCRSDEGMHETQQKMVDTRECRLSM